MHLQMLISEIKKAADPKRAKISSSFFKTGKGQYGEGDIFVGITVPDSRKISLKYPALPLEDISVLLKSKIHEERLIGLLILVHKFEKNIDERKMIFDFYIKNTHGVNNWDLVDLSAPNIVGRFMFNTGKVNPLGTKTLISLAESNNLWERRISIVSTYYFIKNKRFDETFAISDMLMQDKHDLIHKAVGWMLREVGKRDENALKNYLKSRYAKMPRTMLRYSIERFSPNERKAYLEGKI